MDNALSCDAAIDRRAFMKTVGFTGAGLVASQAGGHAQAGANEVPRRAFGKTGVEVSALGLGGHTLGEARDENEAIRIVHQAVDAGITFMDNASEYHDGRSEEWMGKAIEGRRDKVFLMTKVCTHGRDAKEGMRQLEQSLRRHKTDHLDLWQVHEVISTWARSARMASHPCGRETLEGRRR